MYHYLLVIYNVTKRYNGDIEFEENGFRTFLINSHKEKQVIDILGDLNYQVHEYCETASEINIVDYIMNATDIRTNKQFGFWESEEVTPDTDLSEYIISRVIPFKIDANPFVNSKMCILDRMAAKE